MIFEQNKSLEKLGEKLGYVFGYFLFTTILFFILLLLKKIPETWSYFHIMGITILIALLGVIIKRLLK
ncbi:MAG: hypothetical protein QGI89_00890 [Candidatus Woesearchaeota archaeon]|jgi:hypothetical protein|nr:hypothetical protein [Candidatus Woesearchaeota archaeon]|tara:strand:+ start:235 stop:438 length:204 start_codon:yes stop_codon:yes gene_type:complete